MQPLCPKCSALVKQTDYFCFNCGTKFRDPPPSTTIVTQIMYYLGSILLPPLGIFWAIKYLKQPNDLSKRIGWIMVIITFVSIIVTMLVTTRIFTLMQSLLGSYTVGL